MYSIQGYYINNYEKFTNDNSNMAPFENPTDKPKKMTEDEILDQKLLLENKKATEEGRFAIVDLGRSKIEESGNFRLQIQKDFNGILDVGGNKDDTKGFIRQRSFKFENNSWKLMYNSGLQNGDDFRGSYIYSGMYSDYKWNKEDPIKFEILYISSDKKWHYCDMYYYNEEFTYNKPEGAKKNDNMLAKENEKAIEEGRFAIWDLFNSYTETKENGTIDISLKIQKDFNGILDVGGNDDNTKGFISLNTSQFDGKTWKDLHTSGLQNGYDYRNNYNEIWGHRLGECNKSNPLKFVLKYISIDKKEHISTAYYYDNKFSYDKPEKDKKLDEELDKTNKKAIGEGRFTIWDLGRSYIETKENGKNDIYLKIQKDFNGILDVGGNEDNTKGFIRINTYQLDGNIWKDVDGSGLQNGDDYRDIYQGIWDHWLEEWNKSNPLKFVLKYISSDKKEHISTAYYYNNKFSYYKPEIVWKTEIKNRETLATQCEENYKETVNYYNIGIGTAILLFLIYNFLLKKK